MIASSPSRRTTVASSEDRVDRGRSLIGRHRGTPGEGLGTGMLTENSVTPSTDDDPLTSVSLFQQRCLLLLFYQPTLACATPEALAAENAGEVRACVHCEKAAGVSTDATRGRRASAHARVGWSGWDRVPSDSAGARSSVRCAIAEPLVLDAVDGSRDAATSETFG